MKLAALVMVSVVACGSAGPQRDTYAVGGWLGTGAVFGPGTKCTYEVTPAAAAELGEDRSGGKLVAPGTGKVTCESGYKAEFDIVAPDRLAIEGEAQLGAGAAGALRVKVFGGGNRELTTHGHWVVDWQVPPACASVVKTTVDMPAGGDSLRGSYALELVGVVSGTCTVTAVALGQTATRTITVR